MEWEARGIAEPETHVLQVERSFLREPRLHGVPEVGHARTDRSIDRATELNIVERRDFFGEDFRRSGNETNEPLGGSSESTGKLFGWGEGNDDAE